MARLNQLNGSNYTGGDKVHAEFLSLYTFLQATERAGLTIKEQFDLLLTTSGAIKTDLIELRLGSTAIEYRASGGAWTELVTLASIMGPPGVSGDGSGNMVRATYDPNDDGRISTAELDIADGDLTQAKVASLEDDLQARPTIEVSATAPVSPTYPPTGPITLWVDTAAPAAPRVKWWDGDNSVWQAMSSAASSGTTISAGMEMQWAGTAATVPSGWLLEDGSAVSRSGYAALFLAIGTLHGVGDGSTTFNLPDRRGRVAVGVNDTGLPNGRTVSFTERNEAASGGAETHALITAELAAHTHAYSTQPGTGGSSGDWMNGGGEKNTPAVGATGSAGSGTAHNNMQPFAVTNFIIKT